MVPATRDDMTKWGKIGHPVQSRGLSPKDKTPWLTLIITALSCLGLAKAFLVLQANYETEGASWAASSGAASGGGVRRAGASGLGAADAGAPASNALASAVESALDNATQSALGAEALAAASGGLASPMDGLDASCGGELNLDIDGFAVSWGLDYKTVRCAARAATRARSCDARALTCAALLRRRRRSAARRARSTRRKITSPVSAIVGSGAQSRSGAPAILACVCSYRPAESASRLTPLLRSWSPDIWNHTFQECWLKVQDDASAPKVNHRGDFSAAFRKEHKTAPLKTPWMAGVLQGRARR